MRFSERLPCRHHSVAHGHPLARTMPPRHHLLHRFLHADHRTDEGGSKRSVLFELGTLASWRERSIGWSIGGQAPWSLTSSEAKAATRAALRCRLVLAVGRTSKACPTCARSASLFTAALLSVYDRNRPAACRRSPREGACGPVSTPACRHVRPEPPRGGPSCGTRDGPSIPPSVTGTRFEGDGKAMGTGTQIRHGDRGMARETPAGIMSGGIWDASAHKERLYGTYTPDVCLRPAAKLNRSPFITSYLHQSCRVALRGHGMRTAYTRRAAHTLPRPFFGRRSCQRFWGSTWARRTRAWR